MNLPERLRRLYIYRRIKKFTAIEGWLSAREAIELYRHASMLGKNAVIVEIGSWKGRSTYCLAKGLKSGKVFAIDPFDAAGEPGSAELYRRQKGEGPLVRQFEQNMRSFGVLGKVATCAGYSADFAGKFEKIDFLFIDGDHSVEACEKDFRLFSPPLVPGGFIAFHDFDPSRHDLGPTWVVEHHLLGRENFRFLGLHDSLWIAQKVK
ncbi:MAG TPA: class I SAM-dependent methyltransferase [Bacteroidota bacterium]|nr:class I SAM-dependent methyltransferase [Bacteroidota bacterium]